MRRYLYYEPRRMPDIVSDPLAGDRFDDAGMLLPTTI